jgi:uncharacterized SAM-binding protein YcdF (DUF218 family)
MSKTVHIGAVSISRRWIVRSGLVLFLLLLAVLLRGKILKTAGSTLVVEDPAEQVDALFVLSGNAFDRGREGARLYNAGYTPKIVCLGGESNSSLELYNVLVSTAEITKAVVLNNNVPERDIELLEKGTSTFEEFEAITTMCKERGWTKIMVVSSRFHTRRIHEFFRLRLHFEGIKMVLRGAKDIIFEEDCWWKSEPGMIFVNNEYVKLLFYWMNY